MSIYKKQRVPVGETGLVSTSITEQDNRQNVLIDRKIELKGHQGAVLCSRFSSGDGQMIASGGVDKNIYLWNTPTRQNLEQLQVELKSYEASFGHPERENGAIQEVPVNFAVLKGHKSAVTSLKWNNGEDRLISASADKTCGYWDVLRIQRLRKFVSKKSRAGEAAVINDVEYMNGYDEDNNVFASCGDDGCLRLWDVRESLEVAQVGSDYPLLTVHSPYKLALKNKSQGASGGDSSSSDVAAGATASTMIFTAGVEAVIYGYDLRMLKQPRLRIETLHQDSISGLSSSQSIVKDILVSSSADGTVRFYDYGRGDTGGNILSTYFSKPGNNGTYLHRCMWRNLDEFKEIIVSGGQNGLLGVWDTENELGFLRYDDDAIIDCDIHPTHSNVVMASSENGTIYIEEVA